MKLGVCYYPEHWSRNDWGDDARSMREMGLSLVRIGEFAWSRIEPFPGQFDWEWLDQALAHLHQEGLQVIMGTPTATPPKWLVDRHPDILPVDEFGHPRRFGSRRHYCFSSQTYRAESKRIVEAIARRYGEHPAIVMWQTDNEFGHHGSDESFSADAVAAFRKWLEQRYRTIEALNAAWGTVFWSQEYNAFEEVDPPAHCVTEPHPAHRLDWRRFCSDQMCSYNELQVDIIRRLSPGREVTHNFIGDFYRLDHRNISRSLDVATWDSYPIGLLSESNASDEDKARWLRSGDPDFAAFNHDVFRACAPKWGVMEQQPGPVNWATYNPAPAPGMVRLWTWEAFAHGAEFVSYFRWRQLPFAQEQMHAGLLSADRKMQNAVPEIQRFCDERKRVPAIEASRPDVAILIDYSSLWHHEIQPHGNLDGPLSPARALYSACRRKGWNIDFIFPDSDMSGYKLILVPSVRIIAESTAEKLLSSGAVLLAFALSGSRTESAQTAFGSQRSVLAAAAGVQIDEFESLPPFSDVHLSYDGNTFPIGPWREQLVASGDVHARFSDGAPAWVKEDNVNYVGCLPDRALLSVILDEVADEASITRFDLGDDLRIRRAGDVHFAFNYGSRPVDLSAVLTDMTSIEWIIGEETIPPFDISVWRKP